MPRCYMVKKSLRHESRSPCSPTEACVAPPYHSPDENSAFTETRKAEYAELASLPLSERSAADTEAAHELLSLAHSLPPLQQAPDPSAQHEPAALLPVYTYTIQPTNIYIVTDDPPKPVYQTFQAVGPCPCPCDFQNEPHVGYITYQAVPPEQILGPQPEPRSTTEADSDPEPQLEIESDAEPSANQEQEPDSPLRDTDIASDKHTSYTEYDSNELYSEDETKPHGYIESEQIIEYTEYTEIEPSPSRYSESVSYKYSESVTSSVDYAETEAAELHYEPKRPKYSHPDANRSSESEHEYEQERRDEPAEETLPCEAREVQSSNQRWPKKKYDCAQCGKIYATSSNLSRHKQTHRSLDSMMAKRCGECGKVYVSMPALAMHVLTHRMGHVCGICGKQFSRPWLLRGHLRSHTGEKPYNCESCGKAFADRSNLRAHLQTHMPNKKYVCQHCNKTFALKSYLNKHQETACSRPDDE